MAKMLDDAFENKEIRRLVRSQNTQKYFQDNGWTDNPEEAKNFADVVEVAEVCARQGLSEVELALRMRAGAFDVFCTPLR